MIAFVGISMGFYAVFSTSVFLVREVHVFSSYQDINTDRVQVTVSKAALDQHLLFIDTLAIESEVYENYPGISEVNCHKKLLKRALECEAVGYELIAVIKHQAKKYYINENGVVLEYDQRKLGLPLFELVLNPVFAGLSEEEVIALQEQAENESEAASAFTASILSPGVAEPVALLDTEPLKPFSVDLPEGPQNDDLPVDTPENEGVTDAENSDSDSPEDAEETPQISAKDLEKFDSGFEVKTLRFLSPLEGPPPEPIIKNRGREVFVIAEGKQILDPEELDGILNAIRRLEDIMERKVISAQYVQVAGELTLTSKPRALEDRKNAEEDVPGEQSATQENTPTENPDHELIILLDLRRNVEQQLQKLAKAKEVINFQEISRIDLSIDGEKVFYR